MKYKNRKGNDMDWDTIKVHAISHFRSDIARSGTTQHYNAELYENLHQTVRDAISHSSGMNFYVYKQVVKGPYRGSNHRASKTEEYLFKLHERSFVMHLISDFLNKKPAEIRETNFNEV